MRFPDPYTPEESHYECTDCHARIVTDEHVETCTECGGTVWNIAVPRE